MTLEHEAAYRWFSERARDGIRNTINHRRLTAEDLQSWLLEEYTGSGRRVEKLMQGLLLASKERRREETTRFLGAFVANFLEHFGEATR